MAKRPKKQKKNMKPGTNPLAGKDANAGLAPSTPVPQPPPPPARTAPSLAGATQKGDAGTTATVTLDQRRAQFALNKVQKVDSDFPRLGADGSQNRDREKARDYRAYVRRLPAMIIANGLGQAIALELAQSKDSEGHGRLLDHLTAWLVHQDGWGASSPYHGEVEADQNGRYRTTGLIKQIIDQSDADFARAQIEALAFLKWLKTFAEALIEPRDDNTATGHASGDTTGDGGTGAEAAAT